MGVMNTPEPRSVAVARALAALFRSLFTEKWLQNPRNADHPAVFHLRVYDEHVASNGRTVPSVEDPVQVMMHAEFQLNGFHLLEALGGRIADLAPGSLANYGDAKVQRRIRAALRSRSEFHAVMTEIARAAFHIQRYHEVCAREEENRADLKVLIPGVKLPLIIECKRVGEDSSPERFLNVVKKANKQIGAENTDSYGILVIDITDRVRLYRRRTRWGKSWTHRVPEPLAEIRAAVRSALSRPRGSSNVSEPTCFYSNISCAVLVWNEITVRPDTHGANKVVIRKRTEVISHRDPRHRLPEDVIVVLEEGAGSYEARITQTPTTDPP